MMSQLSEWQNFYIIVGSSAGALIGLQFVVITLIDRAAQPVAEAGAAFATPSVVHFGAVLLLSAIVNVPWNAITAPAVLWGLGGIIGIVYSAVVARRMRKQTAYRPVFEDWLFHALLPLAAYAALAVSALFARSNPAGALLIVGASSLLLLFIGIHNAWDSATYNIFSRERK
jgi:hypothetical protein